MWRSKKFIVGVVLAAVLLFGSIGGVALANTENGDDSQPEARYEALLDRVCEIYEENTGVAINPPELEDAFAQARREIRDEGADRYLQNLIDQGKISQDEADQHQEWFQARPDVPLQRPFDHGFGPRGFRGGPCDWGRLHPTE